METEYNVQENEITLTKSNWWTYSSYVQKEWIKSPYNIIHTNLIVVSVVVDQHRNTNTTKFTEKKKRLKRPSSKYEQSVHK